MLTEMSLNAIFPSPLDRTDLARRQNVRRTPELSTVKTKGEIKCEKETQIILCSAILLKRVLEKYSGKLSN
jgi:hypothetical protein